MTLLERKPLLSSSWSTCNVNVHTRWSAFIGFYMIIWQFLCVLEVLKCETHFWGLFVCFPATASFKGCVYAAIYSLLSSGCTKNQQVDHTNSLYNDTSIYNEDKWDRVWWTKTSLFQNWKALIWNKSVFQKEIHPQPAARYMVTLVNINMHWHFLWYAWRDHCQSDAATLARGKTLSHSSAPLPPFVILSILLEVFF